MGDPSGDVDREEFWRDFLNRGDAKERRVRRVFRALPHAPRCQMCAAPFAGPVAPIMRAFGKRPADKNPRVCHALLDRFYATASAVVFDHDGAVDKFVGDEVVAMFFPFVSCDLHAAKAVQAAEALLRATGHADPTGPWAPVGAGVHTGLAWVGAVGDEAHTEITALGDAVNVAARLAASAAAGEVLVSSAAAWAAGLDPVLEMHALALKGKEGLTEVVSLRVVPDTPISKEG